jgi:hypothetical protein
MKNEPQIQDLKYGLMVIDPTQKGEMLDILHFVGYWEQPTLSDAESLRTELMTDATFGLTDIAHRLEILPAPDYLVHEYLQILTDYE